ncbi:MAG: hypothetical protein ACPG1A_11785 [Halioglobus sp.]
MMNRRTTLQLTRGFTSLSKRAAAAGIVLPNDPSIYGPITEGAMYIARAEYLTLGPGDEVQVWQNADNPGTRDIIFDSGARPTWMPSLGVDGAGTVRLNGTNQWGYATGFNFSQAGGTNEPRVQIVGRYRSTSTPKVGWCTPWIASPQAYIQGFQIRAGNVKRTNGSIINTPHNLDTVIAHDTGYHLWEDNFKDSGGFEFWFDGVQYTGGGTGGATNVNDRFEFGRGSFGGEYADVDIDEIVITEARSAAQAAAYRSIRVANEYPSLP